MIPVIPDKIYLGIQDLSSGYVYNLSLDNNGEQEYIRKDALLEWAKDVKQGLIVEMEKYGVPNEQRIFAFQEFIDKINSL